MGRTKHLSSNKRIGYKGFTIIEVMIVLAIAALVMLIVLFAVPELRRTYRNQNRKHFALYVAAQLENFKTDNRRYPISPTLDLPNDFCTFITNYLSDKSGTSCDILPWPSNCVHAQLASLDVCFHNYGGDHDYIGNSDEVSIEQGHWCNRPPHVDPNPAHASWPLMGVGDDSDSSKYAVWVKLEKVDQTYCVDNS